MWLTFWTLLSSILGGYLRLQLRLLCSEVSQLGIKPTHQHHPILKSKWSQKRGHDSDLLALFILRYFSSSHFCDLFLCRSTWFLQNTNQFLIRNYILNFSTTHISPGIVPKNSLIVPMCLFRHLYQIHDCFLVMLRYHQTTFFTGRNLSKAATRNRPISQRSI